MYNKSNYILIPQGVVNMEFMAGNVTFLAPTTADTEPVILKMGLVLGVQLDMKEHFVKQVFFVVFFIWDKQW